MTFTINVPRDKVAKVPSMGMQYTMDVPLAGPGPYQVRAAVRDQPSGELGSAYAFLNIPDINRQKLSLSSLVLSVPPGTADTPGARASWNEFQAGTTVEFGCEAFGLKPPGTPNLDLEVRLYRGGEPVVKIPPTAAHFMNRDGRLFLAGTLAIPRDLAAGNYAMEIVTYDRIAAPKKQAAEQWADLTVVALLGDDRR